MPVEITKKRNNVVMFSFVVNDFSSCVDDTLKLINPIHKNGYLIIEFLGRKNFYLQK